METLTDKLMSHISDAIFDYEKNVWTSKIFCLLFIGLEMSRHGKSYVYTCFSSCIVTVFGHITTRSRKTRSPNNFVEQDKNTVQNTRILETAILVQLN